MLAASALALVGAGANAAVLDVLDFEAPDFSPGALTTPADVFMDGSVILDTGPGLELSIATFGPPREGFAPDDIPVPADALGGQFLTTGSATTTELSITYRSPLAALTFDLADIDGQGGDAEIYTITLLDRGGMALAPATVIRAGAFGAGDQLVTRVAFFRRMNDIWGVTITGETTDGTREIDIAFDNFQPDVTTCLPHPATLPVLGLGLCALGAARRRCKGT